MLYPMVVPGCKTMTSKVMFLENGSTQLIILQEIIHIGYPFETEDYATLDYRKRTNQSLH